MYCYSVYSSLTVGDSQLLETQNNILHICYKSHPHHVFILVVDTIDFSEDYIFNEISQWVQDLRTVSEVPIILVGTSLGKRTELLTSQTSFEEGDKLPLSREQGEKLAEKLQCFTYIEIDESSEEDLTNLKRLLIKIHVLDGELKARNK